MFDICDFFSPGISKKSSHTSEIISLLDGEECSFIGVIGTDKLEEHAKNHHDKSSTNHIADNSIQDETSLNSEETKFSEIGVSTGRFILHEGQSIIVNYFLKCAKRILYSGELPGGFQIFTKQNIFNFVLYLFCIFILNYSYNIGPVTMYLSHRIL